MDRSSQTPAIICGLFVSTTALVDWYVNASHRRRLLSAQERYLYENFLQQPERVLEPPTTIGKIWLAVMVGLVLFWLGVWAFRLITTGYCVLRGMCNGIYSRAALLVSAAPGIALGYFVVLGLPRLPVVWKVYLSIPIAFLTQFLAFLVLVTPWELYAKRRHKGGRYAG